MVKNKYSSLKSMAKVSSCSCQKPLPATFQCIPGSTAPVPIFQPLDFNVLEWGADQQILKTLLEIRSNRTTHECNRTTQKRTKSFKKRSSMQSRKQLLGPRSRTALLSFGTLYHYIYNKYKYKSGSTFLRLLINAFPV